MKERRRDIDIWLRTCAAHCAAPAPHALAAKGGSAGGSCKRLGGGMLSGAGAWRRNRLGVCGH
jgi:hypothetical protein